MKLQLYINGIHYNEIKLPDEEFENDEDCGFEDNVDIRHSRLQVYIEHIKTLFFRQLCKAESYEVILIAESKLNKFKITEDEYTQAFR